MALGNYQNCFYESFSVCDAVDVRKKFSIWGYRYVLSALSTAAVLYISQQRICSVHGVGLTNVISTVILKEIPWSVDSHMCMLLYRS